MLLWQLRWDLLGSGCVSLPTSCPRFARLEGRGEPQLRVRPPPITSPRGWARRRAPGAAAEAAPTTISA
ncbi:hypothetical protein AV530_000807 [Patagioenas fasciata monilis]|uniref:Uncharacterized protein n=1 Tax=Patagioenas fasciata monilis TaxID=372326 RepID=A0A1V4KSB3_PATFA|nr:hypothetical protein AV530_000807 [Patagioenas fasciata monilis]